MIKFHGKVSPFRAGYTKVYWGGWNDTLQGACPQISSKIKRELAGIVNKPAKRLSFGLIKTKGSVLEHTDLLPKYLHTTFAVCIKKPKDPVYLFQREKDIQKIEVEMWGVYSFNSRKLHGVDTKTCENVFWLIIDISKGR